MNETFSNTIEFFSSKLERADKSVFDFEESLAEVYCALVNQCAAIIIYEIDYSSYIAIDKTNAITMYCVKDEDRKDAYLYKVEDFNAAIDLIAECAKLTNLYR